MQRKIVFSLGLLIVGLAVARGVAANEGLVKLLPADGSASGCLALSVFREGRYQILGSCRGLVLPFSAEATRYLLWKADEVGDWKRLTEIEEGKFGVNSDGRFSRLMVTAEQDWSPRKPSGQVVAIGTVEALSLGGVKVEDSRELKTQAQPLPTVTKAAKPVEAVKSSGSVLGAVAKAVVTVVLILIGVGVVLGVITKRKGF